ncbi:WD40/YVTN/BNR-like repeat-containing protein [Acidobacteriota bacterium]
MRFKKNAILTVLSCVLLAAFAYSGETQDRFNENLLKEFSYRNLGPFRSGSWISDFAVPEFPEEAHLYTFYVAGRNGGLWKTTNNGTTFESLFDDQDIFSIGDVTLAPSDPDTVWIGTGEHATTRSSYWGDGVYKSTDGGETWIHLGLKETQHIGRIVIHPKNPDIVYVAAMGHLFSSNKERGVFKTSDGGKTWDKVLYINENVGVIDIVINRNSPDILYAAAYEKYRYPWHFEAGGSGSGIYKTTDAGHTWAKLEEGLPIKKIGRIGLDIYRKNPAILYAVVENCSTRPPTEAEIEQDKRQGREAREREIGGEVYRTDDAGVSWTKMNSTEDNVGGKAAYSFNQIRVDPNDDQKVFVTTISLASSDDGGRTWSDINWPPRKMFLSAFGDIRTLWIDPQNSKRIFMGSDGGVYISYDGGITSDYYDNLPMAQYYAIGIDMEDPYNIYGGLQCHDSWKIPSSSWSGHVTLEDSIPMGGGDGMYNVIDPEDSRWVYNTIQFGGHARVDQKLGTRTNIVPRRDETKEPYRFNWCPPLHISPHNSKMIYTGTQVLLKSIDRGNDWQEISPDLTLNDPDKIAGQGHIQYCTITTISESPVKPGVIWVGTDDGKVWVTRDSGSSWNEITENIAAAGGPDHLWVSRVMASNFEGGKAYVTKTGYRRDDFRPFVFKTGDFGQTWTNISSNLPDKPVNVVYEDRKNPELLFLGNDKGVYVSISGGVRWVPMRNNMPTIAVHDLLVHPRENDLVVGTYGRGIYITDISPLQEIDSDILESEAHFFQVEPTVPRITRGWGNYNLYGDRHLSTPNEPNAVVFNYYLKGASDTPPKLTISNSNGDILAQLEAQTGEGINRIFWNMRAQRIGEQGQERRRSGSQVDPGDYIASLEIDGKTFSQSFRIMERKGWSIL